MSSSTLKTLPETEQCFDVESKESTLKKYEIHLNWDIKSIFMFIFHLFGIIGFGAWHHIQLRTVFFFYTLAIISGLGILAGVHRLWSHRAYKATFGLRLFLAIAQTLAVQDHIYQWVHNHRAHHKWSETDADPHNAKRSFIFSHIGWIFLCKHPELLRKQATIDMSDLGADSIVMFQKAYYWPLWISCNLLFGSLPVLWGESFWLAQLTCTFARLVYVYHITFLINSWAHLSGYRPYDRRIGPADITLRHLQLGEGFHNFHHSFPTDYCAAEFGPKHLFNPTTVFIDVCHYFGLAYDLKRTDQAVIRRQMEAHGKEKDHYKTVNGVLEWLGGLLTLFGPLFLWRWFLMACLG